MSRYIICERSTIVYNGTDEIAAQKAVDDIYNRGKHGIVIKDGEQVNEFNKPQAKIAGMVQYNAVMDGVKSEIASYTMNESEVYTVKDGNNIVYRGTQREIAEEVYTGLSVKHRQTAIYTGIHRDKINKLAVTPVVKFNKVGNLLGDGVKI